MPKYSVVSYEERGIAAPPNWVSNAQNPITGPPGSAAGPKETAIGAHWSSDWA